MERRRRLHGRGLLESAAVAAKSTSTTHSQCAGGLCVGMTNGPHQGGNASYPVAWNGTTGTRVESFMTVPDLPRRMDGITYYMWTDIFFGDGGRWGRMNQMVPQLLLGNALDGSTGPPDYRPQWPKEGKEHTTWVFASHYFFELYNVSTSKVDAHAAYGEFHPVHPGEILYTSFVLSPGDEDGDREDTKPSARPKWTLTMSVVGDPTRTSVLTVPQPYMGLGRNWTNHRSQDHHHQQQRQNGATTTNTTSWLEPPYCHMCLNMCWELYGATDHDHLPSSGATYHLTVQQPKPANKENNHDAGNDGDKNRESSSSGSSYYDFTSWEEDEGNGQCPSCRVVEQHTDETQTVMVEISVIPPPTDSHGPQKRSRGVPGFA